MKVSLLNTVHGLGHVQILHNWPENCEWWFYHHSNRGEEQTVLTVIMLGIVNGISLLCVHMWMCTYITLCMCIFVLASRSPTNTTNMGDTVKLLCNAGESASFPPTHIGLSFSLPISASLIFLPTFPSMSLLFITWNLCRGINNNSHLHTTAACWQCQAATRKGGEGERTAVACLSRWEKIATLTEGVIARWKETD